MHININALTYIQEFTVHSFSYGEIQDLLPKLFITYGRNRKEKSRAEKQTTDSFKGWFW